MSDWIAMGEVLICQSLIHDRNRLCFFSVPGIKGSPTEHWNFHRREKAWAHTLGGNATGGKPGISLHRKCIFPGGRETCRGGEGPPTAHRGDLFGQPRGKP